jgi:tungstate transport system ATP-binding protein
MNAAPAIEVHSLIHAYDGKGVLTIPRLNIPSGAICAVAGPNGSGKTTLLSILALLLEPSAGRLFLHGTEAVRGPGLQSLRRRVTLIHQKPVLFTTTVWNNVSYGLRAAGLAGEEIKARTGAMLEQLGLSDLAGRRACKLSGGEAQLVVLARGLVLETPILLLDEPTSFLDKSFRPQLFDMLRRANKERKATILLATHDIQFVAALAHEVFCLEEGRIVD